ncbi:hypothetical protein GF1_18340 [Desulfolithobacter dissulfuricans]|uniref:Excinuclease ABC subunit C n=1 Tax=Desulfolithobacter dissulfuricans TaxID=2795293 RepID=A0A915U0Y1_9BACT|nr:hypothetical protein GF1_18340 [Desulfolithobacter dissulfuricans]
MSDSPLSTEFLKTVSHGPGVYQMLGRTEVLYVGKARDLRKRLAQYAHFSGPPHSKTAVMLSHVRRVETILTTTEKEALILEASLIKKHRPRYNVILRDDKNYPLIKVTVKEEWPRIVVTRKRVRDGSKYFGPFSSPSAMRQTLKLLYTLFPLRRCRTVRSRSRPCLNFQMGRCLAPCTDQVDQDSYRDMVRQVLLILEGKNQEVLIRLEEKMREAAADLAFEKAAVLRDQIRALKKTVERQMVVANHFLDQDVFGLARRDASVTIAILFIRGGVLGGSQTFFLADPMGDDQAILAQTITQYYSARRQPPREILLPLALEDAPIINEYLAELRQGPVSLAVPRRGRRMQLMEMAHANARQVFADKSKKKKAWETLAASLQKLLHLNRRPETIWCVDISNLGGKQAVGSLVCFVRGEKHPPGYRHFKIRCKDEPDDYTMMHEVLERRLGRGGKKAICPTSCCSTAARVSST